MTNKELMSQILQELQNLEQQTKIMQSFGLQKKVDAEVCNRRRRIERRKKQLKEDMGKTLSLIKSGYWKFSEARRIKADGYVWECCDGDGIKIVGKVGSYETQIKFLFTDEEIKVPSRYCHFLEGAVNSDNQLFAIWDWQRERNAIYGFEVSKNRFTTYKDKCYSSGGIHRCIYCGASTSNGSACDVCRNRYQKRRHGVGGYPSIDPYAKGNNGDKYYNQTKKGK